VLANVVCCDNHPAVPKIDVCPTFVAQRIDPHAGVRDDQDNIVLVLQTRV
jgi:hypothetical protein